MKCIEENEERLDLLNKTLDLENKQKKRIREITSENEKEAADKDLKDLYENNSSNTTTSLLDQEESLRKQLVDSMIQSATPAITPVVKVLTNVQGN